MFVKVVYSGHINHVHHGTDSGLGFWCKTEERFYREGLNGTYFIPMQRTCSPTSVRFNSFPEHRAPPGASGTLPPYYAQRIEGGIFRQFSGCGNVVLGESILSFNIYWQANATRRLWIPYANYIDFGTHHLVVDIPNFNYATPEGRAIAAGLGGASPPFGTYRDESGAIHPDSGTITWSLVPGEL